MIRAFFFVEKKKKKVVYVREKLNFFFKYIEKKLGHWVLFFFARKVFLTFLIYENTRFQFIVFKKSKSFNTLKYPDLCTSIYYVSLYSAGKIDRNLLWWGRYSLNFHWLKTHFHLKKKKESVFSIDGREMKIFHQKRTCGLFSTSEKFTGFIAHVCCFSVFFFIFLRPNFIIWKCWKT